MTLEFDGIEFGYDGGRLLTSIHMTCRRNQIVGLLGRNGTGKSTLMKIVFGTLRPGIGSIRINGMPLTSPGFSKRRVAFLPQDSFLPHDLRLNTIFKLYDVTRERILKYFPELEDDMALTAGQLSGGRLRLIEVLLVLLGRSSFCLLDEPFTGLSPLFIERLQEVMVSEKQNKGIILSDHLYREVMEIADSVYVIANGRTYEIVEEDGLVRRGYLV